jgi:serine/threonine protein kinase
MNESPNEEMRPGSTGANSERICAILDSFANRLRQGEHPSVNEFVARHPELTEEFKELLLALVEIEQIGPSNEAHSVGTVSRGKDAPCPAIARSGQIPERLGDYRILREIGSGGMGVVYEAVRESLSSNVALKVMHPRFRADPTYLRRFHLEARSAARLQHSNIVSVFDYGEHEGVCYYAMQYIAGHGLDRILDEVRRVRGAEPDRGTLVEYQPTAGASRQSNQVQSSASAEGRHAQNARSGSAQRSIALGLLTGRFADGTAFGSTEAAEGGVAETVPRVGGQSSVDKLRTPLDPPIVRGIGLGRQPASSPPYEGGAGGGLREPSSLIVTTHDRYWREVARLAVQGADALAYAHKRGVVHRDIKPSNLLVDALGNLWVTDFGLAKFEESETLSHSRDVIGTLRYMAPERFRGASDGSCDIYALGATIYEMLTLRPAFLGNDHLQLIDQIVNEAPQPPRRIDPRIPRDLETIVLKALAKHPTDRFVTADELADELRRYVENRPIRSRPVSVTERFWRWCKRNPALAALTGLAATLVSVIAIVSTFSAARLGVEAHRAQRAESAAVERLFRASFA